MPSRCLLIVSAVSIGCAQPGETLAQLEPSADERARALADSFLDGWFERNPGVGDLLRRSGTTPRPADGSTRSAALQAWQAKEDAWLREAQAIDPATIQSGALRATYAIVRETLEGSIGTRVCRLELWPVSQMTGWHVQLGYLVTIQPVGSDEARKEALARWSGAAGLHRHRDREPARRRSPALSGAEAERRDRDRSARHADRTRRTRRFCRRRRATDSRGLQAGVRGAGAQPADCRRSPAIATSCAPNICRRRAQTIAVAANPDGGALLRRVGARVQHAVAVGAGGARARAEADRRLMGEMRTIAERSFKTSDVPALLEAPAHRPAPPVPESAGAHRLQHRGAGAGEGGGARLVRPPAARPTSGSSRIPPIARRTRRTNTTRRPRTAAVPGSSTSAPIRLRRRAARRSSRPPSTRRFPAITCRRAIAHRAQGYPPGRALSGQQRLRRGLGAVFREARRRDEAVLVRRGSAGHAVVAGVPRRAAGDRHRHARARVGPAAGDRLHARAYDRIGRRHRGPRSIATSSGRARPPSYMLGDARDSSGSATKRSRSSGRVRHQGLPRPRPRGRRRAARRYLTRKIQSWSPRLLDRLPAVEPALDLLLEAALRSAGSTAVLRARAAGRSCRSTPSASSCA